MFMRPWQRFYPAFEGEDGNGSGKDATPAAAGDGGDAGRTSPESPPSRPDHIPEKFWDAEKGVVRSDALVQSYTELERRMSKTPAQLEREIRERLEGERFGKRPADPVGYKFEVSDGILPEGTDWKVDENDPMLDWWRQHAYEQGLDQEGFRAGIDAYVQARLGGEPDLQAEVARLGENSQERIERAVNWTKANLTQASFDAIADAMQTAEAFQALEELMEKAGEPRFSKGEPSKAPSAKSRDEVVAMMNDERYWHHAKRDPAYVKQVQALLEQTFPGTSPLNVSQSGG